MRAFSISELDICKQILPFLFYFVFCKENRLSLASLDESYVEVLANTYAYVYESGISISKYICTLTVLPTGTLLGSTWHLTLKKSQRVSKHLYAFSILLSYYPFPGNKVLMEFPPGAGGGVWRWFFESIRFKRWVRAWASGEEGLGWLEQLEGICDLTRQDQTEKPSKFCISDEANLIFDIS